VVSFKRVVLLRRRSNATVVVRVFTVQVGNSVVASNHDVLSACVVIGRTSPTNTSLNVLLFEECELRAQLLYLFGNELVLPNSIAERLVLLSRRD